MVLIIKKRLQKKAMNLVKDIVAKYKAVHHFKYSINISVYPYGTINNCI